MTQHMLAHCVRALHVLIVLLACQACSGSYSLPRDWPIRELTLPPGATMTRKATVMQLPGPQKKSWLVYFDSLEDLQTVADHVESCLAGLSYSEHWIDNPRIGSSRRNMRTYYSADQLTEVVLMPGTGSDAGIPGGFASQYTLTVHHWHSPNPVLKYAGTTSSKGVRHELRPLQ